jgi:hypothetical protein
MSNLRLINETTASSVSSVDITDVFSADFDIYKITLNSRKTASGTLKIRMINSSGSIISSSNYDYAQADMYANTTFGETRSTNNNYYRTLIADDYFSTVLYIFNPNNALSYSFFLSQQIGYYNAAGIPTLTSKQIGVLKQTASMSGIHFVSDTGTLTDFNCKIYGLRVDS